MIPAEIIPIAADHAGFTMKQHLVEELSAMGYQPEDLGAHTEVPSDDYPDYAHPLAEEVSSGKAKRGILLCGSGIGMDIVANRYPGVRAALAWEPLIAELSRKHNNSNVLVLPARFITDEQGAEIMKKWLTTDFEGGRHTRRIEKIEETAEQ